MTDLLIMPTTAVAASLPFRVTAGMPIAVRAWGLAGAETMTIQISRGDGTEVFDNIVGDSGTLTAAIPQSAILVGGLFRLIKTATASAAGASKD